MNKELKILFKKSIIFIIPIVIWMGIVVVIDPFNYFNISQIISKESKEKSAQELNSLLYNSINFSNAPTPNVIIGDSRIRKLPVDRIKEINGNKYYTLHSNAAKLNEIVDLFWLTTEYIDLQNVIIGLNFNLYNEFAYSDRVDDVKEILQNPLIYIFNWNIAETIYLCLKNEFFKTQKNKTKNKEAFWEHTVNVIASNHYSKWKAPSNMLSKLKEIGVYCKEKKINLTFLIVPHHQEFHEKLISYKLKEEEINFKRRISKITRVIDFDYPNQITNCKSCFSDPIHANDSINKLIIEELFADSLTIGKRL